MKATDGSLFKEKEFFVSSKSSLQKEEKFEISVYLENNLKNFI